MKLSLSEIHICDQQFHEFLLLLHCQQKLQINLPQIDWNKQSLILENFHSWPSKSRNNPFESSSKFTVPCFKINASVICNKQVCLGCMSNTRFQHPEKFLSIMKGITKFEGTPGSQKFRSPGRSNVPKIYEPIGPDLKKPKKNLKNESILDTYSFYAIAKMREEWKKTHPHFFCLYLEKLLFVSASDVAHRLKSLTRNKNREDTSSQ